MCGVAPAAMGDDDGEVSLSLVQAEIKVRRVLFAQTLCKDFIRENARGVGTAGLAQSRDSLLSRAKPHE